MEEEIAISTNEEELETEISPAIDGIAQLIEALNNFTTLESKIDFLNQYMESEDIDFTDISDIIFETLSEATYEVDSSEGAIDASSVGKFASWLVSVDPEAAAIYVDEILSEHSELTEELTAEISLNLSEMENIDLEDSAEFASEMASINMESAGLIAAGVTQLIGSQSLQFINAVSSSMDNNMSQSMAKIIIEEMSNVSQIINELSQERYNEEIEFQSELIKKKFSNDELLIRMDDPNWQVYNQELMSLYENNLLIKPSIDAGSMLDMVGALVGDENLNEDIISGLGQAMGKMMNYGYMQPDLSALDNNSFDEDKIASLVDSTIETVDVNMVAQYMDPEFMLELETDQIFQESINSKNQLLFGTNNLVNFDDDIYNNVYNPVDLPALGSFVESFNLGVSENVQEEKNISFDTNIYYQSTLEESLISQYQSELTSNISLTYSLIQREITGQKQIEQEEEEQSEIVYTPYTWAGTRDYTYNSKADYDAAVAGGYAGFRSLAEKQADEIFKSLDIIVGTSGNDTNLNGSYINARIFGLEGDDGINGGEGADIIYGGDGNDHIGGGASNDIIYGGFGNDNLSGNGGEDIIYGGEGNDYLDPMGIGGTLYGEEGADIFAFHTYGIPSITSNKLDTHVIKDWNPAEGDKIFWNVGDYFAATPGSTRYGIQTSDQKVLNQATPFADGNLEYEHSGGNTYVRTSQVDWWVSPGWYNQGGELVDGVMKYGRKPYEFHSQQDSGYVFHIEGIVTLDDTNITTDVSV